MSLASKILELQILTETMCSQARGSMNSVKMKILYLIHEYKVISPRVIISKTGIVKSNLALACRKLIDEGCIVSEKSIKNARNIKYSLTEKGEREIKQVMNNITKFFREDELTPESEFAFNVATERLNKKI